MTVTVTVTVTARSDKTPVTRDLSPVTALSAHPTTHSLTHSYSHVLDEGGSCDPTRTYSPLATPSTEQYSTYIDKTAAPRDGPNALDGLDGFPGVCH